MVYMDMVEVFSLTNVASHYAATACETVSKRSP